MKTPANTRTSTSTRTSRNVLLVVFFALLLCGGALAQTSTSAIFSVNSPIPDNDASGFASTVSLSSPGITSIENLGVTLSIGGGFNGDLYAYLTHSSGFAVLLNRVGRTTANGLGYADSGFNLTLEDAAANGDIHSYQLLVNPGGAALSGTWAPDARQIDPTAALDSSPRSAFLSSFNGLDPNGTWTLFVADVSPGGISTLDSWGLQVVGVPEPSTMTLFVLCGAFVLFFRRYKDVGPIQPR